MTTRERLMLATLVLLSACSRPAEEQAAAQPTDVAAPIVPAILPPEETGLPSTPPSYEVAIASAAADHNKALERCLEQPEAVRSQCEQEANAAFAEARTGIQGLRGNQQ
jgi:hypothetical protein